MAIILDKTTEIIRYSLPEYVADALNSFNKGYFTDVLVFSTKIRFGKGEPDEKIIPVIGKASGILITKDIHMGRNYRESKTREKTFRI